MKYARTQNKIKKTQCSTYIKTARNEKKTKTMRELRQKTQLSYYITKEFIQFSFSSPI